MTAAHIVDHAVGHILERQRDAARAMVFENGHVDDLVHFLRHDERHVRAEGARVVRALEAPAYEGSTAVNRG